ncbi:DUF4123 domain-containing protein [Leisingera sp. SS27]|uniref:DUF4123 domain-containing protein n=1 Tax=Leisingera sp. SS27 TaxID=2979462 RepID=UPI00232CF639|nr:DUF4123 domain-containing protein [Leisingera sp. SS27]MDC0660825.1 DUF4123 domain-containing protein [Leisingera sp. SS27]
MTMHPIWIADCELSALEEAQPFWGGGHGKVLAQLMLRAAGRPELEATLRASVAAGQARLSKVRSAQLLSELPPSEQLTAAAARADAARPVLVAEPVPLASGVPLCFEEVNWDALEPSRELWAVLDGVNWPGLPQLISGSRLESACLYTTQDPEKLAAAPWIIRLDRLDPLYSELRKRPPQEHSGILLKTCLGTEELRRHLRRFTMLPTPIGTAVPQYFRFYDPRVLLDSTVALPPEVLGQLLRPFNSVIVPLSPQCVVPDPSKISEPPGIFSPPESCRNRLVQLTWDTALTDCPDRPLRIDEVSFEKFGRLHRDRAVAKLALFLHSSQQECYSQEECLRAATLAPEAAARFGMSSKKQITAIARTLLKFGDAFWERHSEAHAALTEPGKLPWQRKNSLLEWMTRMDQEQLLRDVAGGER